jgi:O-antigen ligase
MRLSGVSGVGTLGGYAALCLFMLLVSAVWIESDAYRYAAVILVFWGLAEYWRAEFRPCIGWMGYLCIAWVAFVAMRYVLVYLDPSVRSRGTSEGIYLFPILYSTVGYMMFRFRHVLGAAATLFIVVSIAMAAITLQPSALFESGPVAFLMMNNTIHSSVGAGFIILAAINFAGFISRNQPGRMHRVLWEIAAYATVALCVVGLYGAKSKGVWVALAIAFCAQAFVSLRSSYGKRGRLIGLGFVTALAAFVSAFSAGIWSRIGPTYDSAMAIARSMVNSGRPAEAIHAAIASGTVPESMNIRLMLWANAVEVWSHDLILGNGIGWKDLWVDARYRDVGFDLIHNGYLEVAVRYGLVGLAFYGVLYVWSVAMARRASARGLIPPQAFNFHVVSLIFFLVTIMTNSNNRLAIGESYMLVAAAFGFFCHFACRYEDRIGAPAVAIPLHESEKAARHVPA